MLRYPTRLLAPAVVVAALLLGCAHSGGSGQSEAAATPVPPPPPSATVTSDEITEPPARSLEQLLMGRVAGVTVSRAPGGGISVLIRGPGSFYLTSQPLYVINGVPVEPGPGGALNWINPQDIESITVLKDASSTAIYGTRGANGVIVITLKGTH